MTTLIVRPYAGETDLAAIAHLCNLCAPVDGIEHHVSIADIRTSFAEPGFDPERNLRLWEDPDGQLIAMSEISLPSQFYQEADGYLHYWVHPSQRNRGLEFEILAWAEVRMRKVGQQKGLPARLYISCRDYQDDRRSLYEKCEFAFERRFLQMERSLMEPLPETQIPEGFTFSHTRGIADATTWIKAHNATFVDHWNYRPVTIEQHCYWITGSRYRSDLDLVAIAPDGQFAAFCFCYINSEENQHRNCREGWIRVLGTQPEFRRMGLGRAMLLSGLHKLRAEGMDTALLKVDTENPHQAQRLYEAVGFRPRYAQLSYTKHIA